MKKIVIFLVFVLLSALFAGCGSTKIYTDKNINADIYVNGQMKGRQEVTIQRRGIPKKVEITAKYRGKTVGNIVVWRKFDWSTFFIGYVTYGVGLLTAWRFPEQIFIPTRPLTPEDEISPWENPSISVWMKPVNKKD